LVTNAQHPQDKAKEESQNNEPLVTGPAEAVLNFTLPG